MQTATLRLERFPELQYPERLAAVNRKLVKGIVSAREIVGVTGMRIDDAATLLTTLEADGLGVPYQAVYHPACEDGMTVPVFITGDKLTIPFECPDCGRMVNAGEYYAEPVTYLSHSVKVEVW